MAILIWWLPPILATAISVAWVVWSARRERGDRVSVGHGGSRLSETQLRRMARVLGNRRSPGSRRTRTDDPS